MLLSVLSQLLSDVVVSVITTIIGCCCQCYHNYYRDVVVVLSYHHKVLCNVNDSIISLSQYVTEGWFCEF